MKKGQQIIKLPCAGLLLKITGAAHCHFCSISGEFSFNRLNHVDLIAPFPLDSKSNYTHISIINGNPLIIKSKKVEGVNKYTYMSILIQINPDDFCLYEGYPIFTVNLQSVKFIFNFVCCVFCLFYWQMNCSHNSECKEVERVCNHGCTKKCTNRTVT